MIGSRCEQVPMKLNMFSIGLNMICMIKGLPLDKHAQVCYFNSTKVLNFNIRSINPRVFLLYIGYSVGLGIERLLDQTHLAAPLRIPGSGTLPAKPRARPSHTMSL